MAIQCLKSVGLAFLLVLVSVLWPPFASTHGHTHGNKHGHNHLHALHVRNASINGTANSASAADLVAQALKAMAVRNKARLENPKFNRPVLVQLTKDPELAPPLLGIGNKSHQNGTLGRRQTSNDTAVASAYSIPSDIADAARQLAEAAPQTPLGNQPEVASRIRNKYAARTNDTNTPERLKTPEGRLSAWGPGGPGAQGLGVVAAIASNSTDGIESRAEAGSQTQIRQSSEYWMVDSPQLGKSPWSHDPNYQVWRNVKDFGAYGDGVRDDTAAINAAISQGGRCGPNCGSSTRFPAVVYFPPGTYLVSSPIIQYYNTQFLGNPHSLPTILAASSFVGLGVITSDVYVSDNEQWYLNTANFLRSVRNFKIDIRLTDPAAGICGIHWQVAQGSSLENIEFYMLYNSDVPGNTQQGIYMENGSGGFLADLTFVGGNFGAYFGNQQFTTSHLVFVNCNTAVQVHWDWAWTMQDFIIESCSSGLVIVGGAGGPQSTGQGVGSLILVDSVIANTPNGIVTSLAAENSTSFLLQNVGFFNVQTAVHDVQRSATLLAGGNEVHVANWGFGRINNATAATAGGGSGQADQGSQFVNGGNIPVMARQPALLGGAYDHMSPNFFTRRRPTYYNEPASRIMNVKALGARGDGVTDDTAALNSILDGAANTSSIVYFPFGIYIIRDTLRIPLGSRVIGQVWSQIMATGPNFADESHPRAVVQVGRPGDRGIIEIQDMLFTVGGPTAGAVVVEWNAHESTQGSVGMWDSHVRVGGATGSDLQWEHCPKTGGAINPRCKAASMLMHMTPGSSGYLENIWLWTADHDMDKRFLDQVDIYAGRGLLIESDLAWLWGTAVEHCVLYQYQLSGAKNILMGMIQTESPYFQPMPAAPQPFTPGLFPNDPTFQGCSGGSCASSWAVRIVDSSAVYMLGAGLYSWFFDYSQVCLATENCQQRGFEVVQSSDLWIYNLCTKAIVEMMSPLGKVPTLAAENVNGFLSSIMAWLQGARDVSGERDFEGFQIYTLEGLSEMAETGSNPIRFPPTCRTALTQLIECDPLVADFGRLEWHGALGNDSLTNSVCATTCRLSVKSWFDNVEDTCAGYTIENGAPATLVGGRMFSALNETCLKDTQTRKYCNDLIAGFSLAHPISEMPRSEACSFCFVERHKIMQRTPYSIYNEFYKERLSAIAQRCWLTLETSIPPPIIPHPEKEELCVSARKHTVSQGETCDSLALAGSFSSAALFIGNPGKIRSCDDLNQGTELCLPLTCSMTYSVQANDSCISIEDAHWSAGIELGAVRRYNPWVDFACSNLVAAGEDAYGQVICLSPQDGGSNQTAPPSAGTTPRTNHPGLTWTPVPLPPGAIIAPGSAAKCGKWWLADQGDLCAHMAAMGPTTIDALLRVNPSLGTTYGGCDALVLKGVTYCVLPVVGWNFNLGDMQSSYSTTRTITMGGPDTESSTTISSTSDTAILTASTTATSGSSSSSSSSSPSSGPPSTADPESTPTPTSDPSGRYYGCYTEGSSSRALSGPSTTAFTLMTPVLCASFCKASGNSLWGVEYGGECYCGNALSAGALPTFESQCSVPCPGDAATMCGGGNRLSLYGSAPDPPPVTPPSGGPDVTAYAYLGCRTEGEGVRALGGAGVADGAQMTVAACGSFCLAGGFVLFGMEYSAECWCGGELHATSAVAPESDCGMPCSGDAAEKCGGPNRLSVWMWS